MDHVSSQGSADPLPSLGKTIHEILERSKTYTAHILQVDHGTEPSATDHRNATTRMPRKSSQDVSLYTSASENAYGNLH